MGEFDDTDMDSTPDVSEPEVDTSVEDTVDFTDDSFTEADWNFVNAEAQEAYDEYDLAHGESFDEQGTEGTETADVADDLSSAEDMGDTATDTQKTIDESDLTDAESYDEQGTEGTEGTESADVTDDSAAGEDTGDTATDTQEAQDESDPADGESFDEQGKIEEVSREAEERAALEADVKARGEALNKEYIDLMDKKNAAFMSTIDATNVEDRERFADLQYDLGEQMEQVRGKMIENNNRLK